MNATTNGGLKLFTKAEPLLGYFKVGVLGEPSAGKSTTATYLMIGLLKAIKEKRPVDQS